MIIMRLKSDMLRDARDRRGITQGTVAEALGMSIATISKAENEGEIHPSTGRQICSYLGIDLAKAVIPRHRNGNGNGDAA